MAHKPEPIPSPQQYQPANGQQPLSEEKSLKKKTYFLRFCSTTRGGSNRGVVLVKDPIQLFSWLKLFFYIELLS